jgi:hypothetical protein
MAIVTVMKEMFYLKKEKKIKIYNTDLSLQHFFAHNSVNYSKALKSIEYVVHYILRQHNKVILKALTD